MTKTVAFPSPEFPAYPAIALEVPDDWSSIGLAHTVLAVGAPIVPGVFRPNIVVSSTRFGPGYTLEAATAAILEKAAGFDQVQEISRWEGTALGGPSFAVDLSFVEERAGTVVQLIQVALIDHGSVVDLVTITATTSAAQAKQIWPRIREIVESAKLAG